MIHPFDFDKNLASNEPPQADLIWRQAKDPVFGLYGSDALFESGYCRLTVSEREKLKPVNEGEAWFGEMPSGIQVRFRTNSAHISLRVKLRAPFDMTNMTQIGQCGADLYVYDDGLGEFVLHEVARFPLDGDCYELSLGHFGNEPRRERRYLLYFPLYMSVISFEIGLEKGAAVSPFGFSNEERIGIYGTSITQGCSASRPGMAYSNLLSRRMDAEVLNFGFSGTAFMEREMGEILGARKLSMLVVDTEPNAGVDERLRDNADGFFEAFFAGNPDADVILFSRILFALDRYDGYRARMHKYYNEYLSSLATKYRLEGRKVWFADGSKILRGNYTEWTVDGVHPSDVGMEAIARAYEQKIRRVRCARLSKQ